MNSLTTVGGRVFDAEEVGPSRRPGPARRVRSEGTSAGGRRAVTVDAAGEVDDPLRRRGLLSRGGGRPDPARRVRSDGLSGWAVAKAAPAAGFEAVDEIGAPADSSPNHSALHTPLPLGRIRSAPAAGWAARKRGLPPPRPDSAPPARRSPRVGRWRAPPLPEEGHQRTIGAAHRATPPSPPAMTGSQSVLTALRDLSESELYASSPYFRRVFREGIERAEHRAEESGLHDVEEALRTCFDVHEDMVRALASQVTVDGSSAAERPRRPWESQPWESEYISPRGVSGHRSVRSGVISTRSIEPEDNHLHEGSHLGSRATRRRGGRPRGDSVHSSLSSVAETQMLSPPPPPLSSTLPLVPQTPGKDLGVLRTLDEMDRGMGVRTLPRRRPTDERSIGVDQRAQMHVQQHLERIDEKIRSIKEGHAVAVRSLTNYESWTGGTYDVGNGISRADKANSMGVVGKMGRSPLEGKGHDEIGAIQMAEEGMEREGDASTENLLVPTLETPGWEPATTTPRAFETPTGRTSDPVFQTPTSKVPPLVGSNVVLGKHHGPGNRVNKLSPIDSMGSSSDAKAKEDIIKAAEHALGLKTIQEYKDLLREKTLEMDGLEHRFRAQLEDRDRKLVAREEEAERFRTAMSEAERAVSALEETISQLEDALHEKDLLIAELEARARMLEEEIESRDAEHQGTVKLLDESISRMGAASKAKDEELTALGMRKGELEAELSAAREDLAASRSAAEEAERTIARKDERIRASEEELASMRENLVDQMERHKTEVSASLENATRLMDLVGQEKDALIDTLNGRISALEAALAEAEEARDKEGRERSDEVERELNDKIQRLALALTEKDDEIKAVRADVKEARREVAKEKEARVVAKETMQAKRSRIAAKKRGSRGRAGGTFTSVNRSSSGARSSGTPQKRRSHAHHRHRGDERQDRERHRQSHHLHSRQRRPWIEEGVPEGYYTDPPQRGVWHFREDARDDDHAAAYIDHPMMDAGRHPTAYYASAEDEDSIFDFP
ncbi:hypothetical protein ACHAWF_015074 [Thalassiosira exigua]